MDDSDLVQWLRHMAKPWHGAANYYTEAADEIERLRADNEKLLAICEKGEK
jgi:hypothetical protein